jgi:hypothetical protein
VMRGDLLLDEGPHHVAERLMLVGEDLACHPAGSSSVSNS